MLLPQKREREYRFRLALRMGLPIFALITILVSNTILTTQQALNPTFYFISILLFTFTTYFILFLIYSSSNTRITDYITKTFTREYLFSFLKKELKKDSDYTLVLFSVENLGDINNIYGLKNGDKVLKNMVEWVSQHLKEQGVHNFPFGHVKGGDFIIGIKGLREDYSTMIDIMCIKSEKLRVNDIEIVVSSSIVDTKYSRSLEFLIENLYHTQKQQKTIRKNRKDEGTNPNELESIVIQTIKNRNIIIKTQDVFYKDEPYIKECSIKLLSDDGKVIHQKEFMKVVNRLGFEVEYDLIVLEKIVTECIENEEGIYAHTISPRSLRNPIFIAKSKELLKDFKNSQGRVMFILRESEYYAQTKRYNSIIKSFRELGMKFAIDRLGSLHTSFLYFKELDIDAVRFDSSYSKNDRFNDIIEGFGYMAQKKGIKTWIKMIENKELKIRADKLSIDFQQGNFLSPLQKRSI